MSKVTRIRFRQLPGNHWFEGTVESDTTHQYRVRLDDGQRRNVSRKAIATGYIECELSVVDPVDLFYTSRPEFGLVHAYASRESSWSLCGNARNCGGGLLRKAKDIGCPECRTQAGPANATEIDAGAIFSDDRKHRFKLWRIWQPEPRMIVFIGLNPSTADETTNDPTVRRCINYARRWGYGGMFMANIFAYRATDPADMKAAADPIGEHNDSFLNSMVAECETAVACWGTHGAHRERHAEVTGFLSGLKCFGKTKEGFPRHPLYLPNTAQLEDFN